MKPWALATLALAGCTFDGWTYRPRDASPEAAMDAAADVTPDLLDAPDAPDVTDALDATTDALDVTDAFDATTDAPDAPDAPVDVILDAACDACPSSTPRPIAPLSGSVLSTGRPTLRWQLAAGATGTTIEVCRDRACTMVELTFSTALDRQTVPMYLSSGVHWWRAAGTVSGSRSTGFSPSWPFISGPRPAGPESVVGRMLDLDGDGYADLATSTSDPGGAVREIHGGPGALADRGTLVHATGSAADREDDLFGERLSAAGDVDGDGFTDLVVSSRGYARSRGAAWWVRGGPVTGERVPVRIDPPAGAGVEFGTNVAGVGDVNGDGYGDLLVSTSGIGGAVTAYLLAGGPDGPGRVLNTLRGVPGESFGPALSGVGDLDADGFADVAIGGYAADARGQVTVYLGSASGLVESSTRRIPSPSALRYNSFGGAISPAGDVDGDGYADLVVGDYADGHGRAYLFPGGAAGPATTPSVTLESPSGGDDFGATVCGVGDVDGDGFSDVLVGAPQSDGDSGRAWLYRGHPTAPLAASPQALAWSPSTDGGAAINQRYGTSLSSVGDLDRDGYADLVVGAASRSGLLRESLVVFRGGGSGAVTPAAWVIVSPFAPSLRDYGFALAP